MNLPDWQRHPLEVEKLSRIFDATTTTYKYWFFLSLLDLMPTHEEINALQDATHDSERLHHELILSAGEATCDNSNLWDIPLHLVLWHMLELSFKTVSEFHVHFPYFDRLPQLIHKVASVLRLQEQALTDLNVQSALQLLGRAIYQDQCLEQGKTHTWPFTYQNFGSNESLDAGKGSGLTTTKAASTAPLPDYAEFLDEFAQLNKYVIYRLLSPWIGSKDALAKFSAKSTDPSKANLLLPYSLGQVPLKTLAAKWRPDHLTQGVNTLSSTALKLFDDLKAALPLAPCSKINLEHKIMVVRLDRHWLAYFNQHKAILQAFTYQKLASKLEPLNPLMPALLAKLIPQGKRDSLNTQRLYFMSFLQEHDLQNIYTGELISCRDNLALDHFLPWSFVHHDLIWNLTPISPELNSSKSNLLPDASFISQLACQQLQLLRFHVAQGQAQVAELNKRQGYGILEENYLGPKFNAVISDFLELGQGRSLRELSQCSPQEFYQLLAAQLEPALMIAKNQGFAAWDFHHM